MNVRAAIFALRDLKRGFSLGDNIDGVVNPCNVLLLALLPTKPRHFRSAFSLGACVRCVRSMYQNGH